jgi:AraC family transcriptional regulator
MHRGKFAGLLEPQALVITPPGEAVVDTIGNHTRTLHFFLKDSVLREVAEDIFDLGKVEFHYKASFGATDPILSQLMRATKQMLLEGLYQDWRGEYLARAISSHILQRHCVLDGKDPLMPTYGCQRLNSEKWTNICIPTWSSLSHSENWPHMLA